MQNWFIWGFSTRKIKTNETKNHSVTQYAIQREREMYRNTQKETKKLLLSLTLSLTSAMKQTVEYL